ncbi:MAG TPA: hypothetical protein VFH51_06920 [Myxococcota bacterium]|nr:hypothetical protein [Myxococcota bacterium]
MISLCSVANGRPMQAKRAPAGTSRKKHDGISLRKVCERAVVAMTAIPRRAVAAPAMPAGQIKTYTNANGTLFAVLANQGSFHNGYIFRSVEAECNATTSDAAFDPSWPQIDEALFYNNAGSLVAHLGAVYAPNGSAPDASYLGCVADAMDHGECDAMGLVIGLGVGLGIGIPLLGIGACIFHSISDRSIVTATKALYRTTPQAIGASAGLVSVLAAFAILTGLACGTGALGASYDGKTWKDYPYAEPDTALRPQSDQCMLVAAFGGVFVIPLALGVAALASCAVGRVNRRATPGTGVNGTEYRLAASM